ncbi:MAG: hypothetical protein QG589_153 [Patescibacteria group bacterium]|nr:hypothetical protein [Patescibacteria group bacterium]
MLHREVAEELLEMGRVDQEMRRRNLEDPEYWSPKVDSGNTIRMKEIVGQIGWPTVSKVGGEASHTAWLLVQHADHDVDFQEQCLILMKGSGELEVTNRDIAYLEDRVRINSKLPQLFGTQFTEVDGHFIPKEIEDPTHVDDRRAQMGLETLQEGIARMEKKYRKS